MLIIKKTSIAILLTTATVSIMGLVSVSPASAAPLTITVNSTGDSPDATDEGVDFYVCETSTTGECTLRAAIETANQNPGPDTIEFNITGGGVKTITPTSNLPEITGGITIDGYTQPGSSENTSISPAPIDSVLTIGIVMSSANEGLNISGDDSTVRGLSIYSCTVCLNATGANPTIQGNFIGIDPTGLSIGTGLAEKGLQVTGNANGATVGGTSPADRNIIVGGSNVSVGGTYISSVNNFNVLGNYLGVGRNGITGFGPDKNLFIAGSTGGTVGGATEGSANLSSGATELQVISVFSTNVVIQGNYIGVDPTGEVNDSIENGGGIAIQIHSADSLVGGTNPGEGNLIAGVSGAGIIVMTANSVAFGGLGTTENIALLGNSISDIGIFDYPDFGTSNQGIDLLHYEGDEFGTPVTFELKGVTDNDSNDVDTGPNGLINFPVLNSAVQTGTQLDVVYDLDAADSPSDQYRVEFFANDNSTIFGHGPGQTYLGSVTTANGNDLDAQLTLTGGLDVVGKSLSATATAINGTTSTGFGATSEFAQNILVGSASDFDSDTISDAIENLAPNSGDGNDDGIADSQQPTVSSYTIGSTYVTFETNGCSSNGSVSSINESTLEDSDTGFTYPFGLTDFSLNCSRGDTVDITKIVFTDDNADGYSVRKYRPNTHTFEGVTGSNVERTTVGDETALVMTYSIEDGGELDDDGIANGIILDPVGLASIYVSSTPGVSNPTAKGTLAATGNKLEWQLPTIFIEIGFILVLMSVISRKKKVLAQ